MANEFSDLSQALEAVRALHAAICASVADEARGGVLIDALSKAVLRELEPVAQGVSGGDFAYHIRTLGGSCSVSELQPHYAELAGL